MTRTDSASLLVHAAPDAVFAALTDADALAAWLPPAGMHGRFERFDMRTGGGFRMVLTYDDATDAPGKSSADEDVSDVRIVRIDPGERIVQEVEFVSDDPAFHGTMRMTWTLRSVGDGTVVEVRAEGVPSGIGARDHAEGITSSLVNLAGHLER
ncbi:SRPBCC domain-containing protein [Agromyces sp. LHK192]|uniref:SRPBCC domain-containing protein n=1 Tax=Agromyces sp. LHK192 TaxID=2498704 RepID=UPI000FD73469|nr:SRPBCC domain-containing protein [Agromyces sp. LHK192]